MVAGIAAALGFAAMARKYTEPPPPPGGTQPEHGAADRAARDRGWSRPKPEKIPSPTYWPAVFAFGLMFIMWGVISNIYLLCFGFIVAVIGLVYWVLDLRHEYSE
jgi:hypothetical protein